MADLSLIGMTAALLAGAISFVSPCVLPLVPGYVSYIAGRSVGGAMTRAAARLSGSAFGLCSDSPRFS